VIIEEGDEITADDAEILSQLGIEPLEIGLDLKVAYSGGEIFTANELDIDVDQYRSDVEGAAGAAFNLAVNAGVINETTTPTIVQEAVRKARNLSIGEGVPTEDTIEEILAHAASGGRGLDSQLDLESVEIEEESEEESQDESSDESSAEEEVEEDSGDEADEESGEDSEEEEEE
jgi:large subunit ribosomal protein L10